MSDKPTGKPLSELAMDDLTWTLNQPCTVKCANCKWEHHGPAGEGQQAFLQHRLEQHPEIKPRKHRRSGFSQRIAARGRRKSLEARGK